MDFVRRFDLAVSSNSYVDLLPQNCHESWYVLIVQPPVSPHTPLLMRSFFRSIGFGRQRVPAKSPNQNCDSDGPTTRAHSFMTRKPQKDPPATVQPPPSKKATNISPDATAALNAFLFTLDLLGKTPIPGIGAVTGGLSQVVKSVQVRVSSRLSHYPDSNTNFICI